LGWPTEPLLFTALGNNQWSTGLNQPVAALTLQVYFGAQSAYEVQKQQAWVGALVLVALVLITSVLSRMAVRRMHGSKSRGERVIDLKPDGMKGSKGAQRRRRYKPNFTRAMPPDSITSERSPASREESYSAGDAQMDGFSSYRFTVPLLLTS
jgi:hypothetical protein